MITNQNILYCLVGFEYILIVKATVITVILLCQEFLRIRLNKKN